MIYANSFKNWRKFTAVTKCTFVASSLEWLLVMGNATRCEFPFQKHNVDLTVASRCVKRFKRPVDSWS